MLILLQSAMKFPEWLAPLEKKLPEAAAAAKVALAVAAVVEERCEAGTTLSAAAARGAAGKPASGGTLKRKDGESTETTPEQAAGQTWAAAALTAELARFRGQIRKLADRTLVRHGVSGAGLIANLGRKSHVLLLF